MANKPRPNKHCGRCGTPFYASPSHQRRGYGKWCSFKCRDARTLPALVVSDAILVSPVVRSRRLRPAPVLPTLLGEMTALGLDERLGISRNAWERVFSGRDTLDTGQLGAVLRAHPDLGPLILHYLTTHADPL